MFVEGKPRTVFFSPDTLFTAFVATIQKMITYALGEHDPGSAQDWRTSNDFCSPARIYLEFPQQPKYIWDIIFLQQPEYICIPIYLYLFNTGNQNRN